MYDSLCETDADIAGQSVLIFMLFFLPPGFD